MSRTRPQIARDTFCKLHPSQVPDFVEAVGEAIHGEWFLSILVKAIETYGEAPAPASEQVWDSKELA